MFSIITKDTYRSKFPHFLPLCEDGKGFFHSVSYGIVNSFKL